MQAISELFASGVNIIQKRSVYEFYHCGRRRSSSVHWLLGGGELVVGEFSTDDKEKHEEMFCVGIFVFTGFCLADRR